MSYFGLIDVGTRTSENEQPATCTFSRNIQRLALHKVEWGQKMKNFAYMLNCKHT